MTPQDEKSSLEPSHSDEDDNDRSSSSSSDQDADTNFILHLPSFDGPLDLLLHLIERQELDITELSILNVAEQYLEYLRSEEQMSLPELASFVAMGARLLLLKSRAMLNTDSNQDENEEDGNVTGLVEALQEYRRYKTAAEHLRQLQEDHRTTYRREVEPPETTKPTGLDSVTLETLVGLFNQALERLPEPEEQVEIPRERIRLADRVDRLAHTLQRDEHISFRKLVSRSSTRLEVIIDFLAVLELIKAGFLETKQIDPFGDIEIVHIQGVPLPNTMQPESGEDEVVDNASRSTNDNRTVYADP